MSHRIHVWYIDLHLTIILNQMLVNIPYLGGMGYVMEWKDGISSPTSTATNVVAVWTVAEKACYSGRVLGLHRPLDALIFYIDVSWDVLHHAIQANKTTSLYLTIPPSTSKKWHYEQEMTHRAHVWQPCCYTWSPECTGYQAYKSTRFFLCHGFQILWRQHFTSVFCRHERSWAPRFSLGENCEKLGMHRFKRVSLRSWELVPVTLVLKTTWPCLLATPQEVIIGSFYSQRRMMSIS